MSNEEIVAKIQSGEDKSANIERLYLQNTGLIAKVANRYKGVEDFEDLCQEGYFGLVKASELWSPEGGASFSTYAYRWIRASIQRYVDNNGTTVRLPVYERERILTYTKAIEDFYLDFGRDPSPRELREILNLSPLAIDRIKKDACLVNMRSTNEALKDEGDITLEDTIQDERDEIGDLLDDFDRDRLSSLLWSLVNELSDRESDIIKKRYQRGLSLKDCGQEIGISSERVRQIEARAFRKLRKKSVLDKLRPYIEERTIAQAYQATGLESFKRSWTSSPEKAVFLKMTLEERAFSG